MGLLTVLALAATLNVPDRASANVSLAAQGRIVVAVWSAATSAGQADVFAAVSHDAGSSFGTPVRVNSTEFDARINGEQPPHVVLTPARGAPPEIVVVWTSTGSAGATLLTSRSTDGGRTFTKVGSRAGERRGREPRMGVGGGWSGRHPRAVARSSGHGAASRHAGRAAHSRYRRGDRWLCHGTAVVRVPLPSSAGPTPPGR